MEPAGVFECAAKEKELIEALEYPKIRAYLQTLELDVFDVWLKDGRRNEGLPSTPSLA